MERCAVHGTGRRVEADLLHTGGRPDVEWVEHADDYSVDGARAASFYAEIRKSVRAPLTLTPARMLHTEP